MIFLPRCLGYLNALSPESAWCSLFLCGLTSIPVSEKTGQFRGVTSHTSIWCVFMSRSGGCAFTYRASRTEAFCQLLMKFSMFMGAAHEHHSTHCLPDSDGAQHADLPVRNLGHRVSGRSATSTDAGGFLPISFTDPFGRWPVAMDHNRKRTCYVLVMVVASSACLPRSKHNSVSLGRLTEKALSIMIVVHMASALTTEPTRDSFAVWLFCGCMSDEPRFHTRVQRKKE